MSTAAVIHPAPARTRWQQLWHDYSRNRVSVWALGFCVLLLLAALTCAWLAPQNPYDLAVIDMFDSRLPPGSRNLQGMTYWLGTDGQGRDMLSAM